ncbi:Ff.00g118130.m01.CDS01 [Fusarium sp. VM40]|nr:Ff.00g118130.m01.CDS01 [Fusarium sp. VM40]
MNPTQEFTGGSAEDPITEIYWPVFKSAVEEDLARIEVSQPRPIKLTCAICRDLMITTPSQPNRSSDPHHHEAWIQPCGHMVGFSCLSRWVECSDRTNPDRGYYKCPVCAIKIYDHPGCGDVCMGRMIPISVEKYAQIPPVLLEGGLPALACGMCEMDEGLLAIRKYSKIYGFTAGALKEDQHIGVYYESHHDVEPLMEPAHPYSSCKWVGGVDTPKELKAAFSAIKKTWATKATAFWYGIDLQELELAMGVFRSELDDQVMEG